MPANRLAVEASITDKISGPLAKMRDKFDQLGKSKGAQQILGGVGVGVGIKAMSLLGNAVGGVGDFLKGTVGKASDLAETVSKVNVVFKDSAGEIDRWGDKAASAMGLSKRAAEETAASFGNLFLGAGIGQNEITGLSEKVVGLAADLASFNNLPTDDVLEKLRAGLVGEAEPLRTLGVNLTAAATEAEATALGFKKVNGVFTEGQKIQARYSLIVKATTTAQGDFARTADGLANSQKKLDAQWENMQAKIGQKLIPVVLELTKDVTLLFDLLDNPHPGQTIIDQTKAWIAQGVSVKDLDNSLTGVLAQQAELNKVFGMESAKRDLQTVIDLINAAKPAAAAAAAGVSTSFTDMSGAAYAAMHKVAGQTGAVVSDLEDIQKSKWGKLGIAAQATAGMGGGLLDGMAGIIHQIAADVALIEAGAQGGHTPGHKPKGAGQVGGHSEGGWAGLNGPELSWLGEKGTEYVVPHNQLGMLMGGGGGPTVIQLVVDRHVLAEIVEEDLYRRLPDSGARR